MDPNKVYRSLFKHKNIEDFGVPAKYLEHFEANTPLCGG